MGVAPRFLHVVALLMAPALGAFATDHSPAPSASLNAHTSILVEQLRTKLDSLQAGQARPADVDLNIDVVDCDAYPYHDNPLPGAGPRRLLEDLVDAVQTGLQCLAGTGPAGPLHPYHEHQAQRLLTLFEKDSVKTFRCVDDAMFAVAVATPPGGPASDDPLLEQLRQVSYPGVVIDTFRLGGILSRRHDDQTYRSFFHLEDETIFEHRFGKPLRPASLQRYEDRAGLLFHEIVHWLGHEHSALYPDVAHLYETCCFGGSSFIDDAARNASYQQQACNILKDGDLWDLGASRYRQMRIWHDKGYDELKREMRADYTR